MQDYRIKYDIWTTTNNIFLKQLTANIYYLVNLSYITYIIFISLSEYFLTEVHKMDT
jgi:hypothetical protein